MPMHIVLPGGPAALQTFLGNKGHTPDAHHCCQPQFVRPHKIPQQRLVVFTDLQGAGWDEAKRYTEAYNL